MRDATAGRDIYAAKEIHIHEAAATSLGPSLHQLPSPPELVGRDDELRDLLALVQTGGVNIFGIKAGLQGMGGVGKTALAIVLAHRLKDRWPDAQIFLNLRGADPERRSPLSPAEALQSIIHDFYPDAKLPEAVDKLRPIYLSVLQEHNRRVLLLLDNAAGPEQIEPLLSPPNCLLLVTSRNYFTLPGLCPKSIDCLRPEQSVALLRKLAPRVGGDAARAAEMCGHLPLALEVFADVVNDKRLYPVADLLRRFETKQERLSKVDAAFEISYELLAEAGRDRWCQLSVFPGSFALRAAAAVWETDPETARDQLQVLVSASLVEWNQTANRFRLHDLARQFCDGKLTDATRSAAQKHHSIHYCLVLHEAEEIFKRGGVFILGGLALFDAERRNIETGQQWAATQGPRDTTTASLCISYSSCANKVTSLRQHPRQRIAWMELALVAAKSLKHREAEAVALANLGVEYMELGEPRRAIESCEKALVVFRELGNRRGEGSALGNLGVAYINLGEPRRALEFHENALNIDLEIGGSPGEGRHLANIGSAYLELGHPHHAIVFFEHALVVRRKVGDLRGQSITLSALGSAYMMLNDPHRAISFFEQALVISRNLGDRRGEGSGLSNLGMAYGMLSEPRRAIEFLEEALAIAREIGNRRSEGAALSNLGVAHKNLGDVAKAITLAEDAVKIFEQVEDPRSAPIRQQLASWRAQG